MGARLRFQGAGALAGGESGAAPELRAGVGSFARRAQGHGFSAPGAVGGAGLGRTGRIRRIRQIGRIGRVGKTRRARGFGFGAVFVPSRQLALAEEVLAVEEQFVEAGPGHLDQPQFGLAGDGRRAAAFGDVLASTARRLRHLVGCARARVHEAGAELHRGVVEDRRRLETAQLAIASAGAQALGSGGIRRIRPNGRTGRNLSGRAVHALAAIFLRGGFFGFSGKRVVRDWWRAKRCLTRARSESKGAER